MKQITQKYTQPGEWEVMIPFEQEGEEKEWVGIIDARASGHYRLKVVARHTAPGSRGRITVRAVCGAGAVVEIKGIIRIESGAQETEDFLELRVLTLGETARAIAEPELEIKANQVKASHAASVGPIAREIKQYLKSRGLSEQEAVAQIVDGYLGV